MIIDMGYWSKVVRKILLLAGTVFLLLLAYKLMIFYLPFLIAFIIAILLEPIIRFLIKRMKLSRRISAIITVLIIFLLIVGLITLGIIALIGEASNFLSGINEYFDKIYTTISSYIGSIDLQRFKVSEQVSEVINNSTHNFLLTISDFIKNCLTGIITIITSLPKIGLITIITILATLFICMDRVYIIDQFEHHMPEIWVKKISIHLREIITELGSYLRAQLILISITFIQVLIGMFLFNFMGFGVQYPLLAGLGIGFVDALPILGAGSVLIPWGIFSALNGNMSLAIGLVILYVSILVVRQLIEPKIVSSQIGIHPIFTLFAMYTGFKLIGFLGLIAGPIILIIFKNIFGRLIERGVFKSIFDRR